MSGASVLTQPEHKVPEAHWTSKLHDIGWRVYHHATKHSGVGIICSVAYFDPGNWGVDLQAGSQYGYSLLFFVLLAGIFATFLQVLAARLGVVTGLDLASHCRLLFHDRKHNKRLWRWGVHYPLYILSEIAIISTDLAEMLGSAIALVLLFPALPLWAAVLLTAFDVMLILALDNPLKSRPVKLFEYLIAALVLAVLICMALITAKLTVNWGDAFHGFVPSKGLFANGALYTSVGIIGATVMPHSLFLGSHLATQDRVSKKPKKTFSESSLSQPQMSLGPSTSTLLGRLHQSVTRHLRKLFIASPSDETSYPSDVLTHKDRENNALGFVSSHIYHGMIDVVVSLMGFAVIINSLILILSSAVFYYESGAHGDESPANLFDAHSLIRDTVGKPAALLFALALLAAGQSASIVATLAGQSVSEGFLHWKVSPMLRRLITRLLGLVPSVTVAVAVGQNGISTLLVASQVVLSIVLPFITLPLLYLTSSSRIMSVRKSPPRPSSPTPTPALSSLPGILSGPSTPQDDPTSSQALACQANSSSRDPEAVQVEATEFVDFSSGKFMTFVGGAIWLVIVVANVYVLVTL
ncbi:smf Mn2+ and Fe2+ transporter [Paxillus ammoniavirescens]|nr:smf Mn2+ and Fe2+ transporter [Paxillus ammoniavirescens]